MRLKVISASLLILALSIVSTTFVLLTLTSQRWAIQNYFESQVTDSGPTKWTSSLCSANRSPLYRCGFPTVTFNASLNASSCNITICKFYKPYGKNKTSCRLASEYGQESGEFSDGLVGTEQECQQVHYAGNLQIAASVFITLALAILVLLTIGNVLTGAYTAPYAKEEEPIISNSPTNEVGTSGKQHSHTRQPRPHHHESKLSPWTPYVAMALLFFLYAGALLQLLAQYFGVLGLTVTATGPLGIVTGGNYGASTWTIDVALAQYATIAWTTALATAVLIGFVYRTPRYRKFL